MTKKTPEEIASLRANLLKYCGLDTYAMVKVLEKLRIAVKVGKDKIKHTVNIFRFN